MILNVMHIIRILSIVSLVFASVISSLFLKNYITNIPDWYYFILFIISFMIIRLDTTLFIYEQFCRYVKLFIHCIQSNIKKLLNFKLVSYKIKSLMSHIITIVMKLLRTESKLKKIREGILGIIRDIFNVMRIRNILVIFKQLFFNTLYELFSVYIIWISILGFLHLTGLLKIEISDPTSFYQISTLFGLLLGIFQFMLKRNEEKIVTKINGIIRHIESIINKEATFNDFISDLSDDQSNNSLKSWIYKTTDPKLQTLDFFKVLVENKDVAKHIFRSMRKNGTPLSINISYQDSNQKFDVLDMAAEGNSNNRKKLHKAYKDFFCNGAKINEIIDFVNEEIDMNEFRLVALNNMNIVSEIIPQFTNYNLRDYVDELIDECDKSDTKDIDFSSSSEYRQYLHNQVIIRLMKKVID